MPQTIVRPLGQPCCLAHPVNAAPVSNWQERTAHPAEWPEPRRKVRLNRHDSSPCALRLRRLYLDVPARLVDFRPIQSLDLRISQSRKSANRQHGQYFGRFLAGRVQKSAAVGQR